MSGQLLHHSSNGPGENRRRGRFIAGMIYLWTLPTSILGLALLPAALLTGGHAGIIDGVLEIHGGMVRFLLRHCTLMRGGASAMALGHVVIGLDQFTLDMTRPHERIHVRQAERWGPIFIPAYLLGSVIALLRGKRAYLDNPFEREAYGSQEFH